MAWHSTAHLSHIRTVKTLECLQASTNSTATREHINYTVEVDRKYMPIVVPLIVGNVLFPRFLRWEVADQVSTVASTAAKLGEMPEVQLTELVHKAAYHNNTLGYSQYASPVDAEAKYVNTDMLEFMMANFSPDKMCFVGVNVDHSEFSKWIMRAFVDYNPIPPSGVERAKAVYTGGDARREGPGNMCHLAIAYEYGGWNSAELVSLTVLQTLLGGGGSFSQGGPGKGMHSRLYTEVMGKSAAVENSVCFNQSYSDSGLFGIYLAGHPLGGAEVTKQAAEQMSKIGKVTPDELKRAKNALKASVFMNLESRHVLLEDTARQLLMSDKHVPAEEFASRIDGVTADSIASAVNKLKSKAPTVAAYGAIQTIPHYNEICAMLKK